MDKKAPHSASWAVILILAIWMSAIIGAGVATGRSSSSAAETNVLPDETTLTPTETATGIPTFCPRGTPEPLWVEPVTSPTKQLTQTIIVRIGNGAAMTVTAESGVFAVIGSFDAYAHPAQVEMALLANTTHHLRVYATVRTVNQGGCVYGGYTLATERDRNSAPLVIVQQPVDSTPTVTATPLKLARAYLPLVLRSGSGATGNPTPSGAAAYTPTAGTPMPTRTSWVTSTPGSPPPTLHPGTLTAMPSPTLWIPPTSWITPGH
jgi:hypothetical protein